MVIDDVLLERAKTASTRITELEREALLARAEYHTAVRRLHLGGGSLREIAAALGISHQRVQQIVGDAGGSWWQKVWRTRGRKRDAVCTFCGKPPSEVEQLVAGPDVYACNHCLARMETALARGGSATFEVASKGGAARCSFCRQRSSAERQVVASEQASVCVPCLRICREIVDAAATAR